MAEKCQLGQPLFGLSKRAVKVLSKSASQKLFYNAQTPEDFPWKTRQDGEHTENFLCVHDNHRKDSKYGVPRERSAPLFTYDSCRYRQDYRQKPHMDMEVNHELKAFGKDRGSGSRSRRPQVDFGSGTHYSKDFPAYGADDMRNARRRPKAEPPREAVDGCRMLIKESHTQETYGTRAISSAIGVQSWKPQPHLELGERSSDFWRTSYSRTYTPQQAVAHA